MSSFTSFLPPLCTSSQPLYLSLLRETRPPPTHQSLPRTPSKYPDTTYTTAPSPYTNHNTIIRTQVRTAKTPTSPSQTPPSPTLPPPPTPPMPSEPPLPVLTSSHRSAWRHGSASAHPSRPVPLSPRDSPQWVASPLAGPCWTCAAAICGRTGPWARRR